MPNFLPLLLGLILDFASVDRSQRYGFRCRFILPVLLMDVSEPSLNGSLEVHTFELPQHGARVANVCDLIGVPNEKPCADSMDSTSLRKVKSIQLYGARVRDGRSL